MSAPEAGEKTVDLDVFEAAGRALVASVPEDSNDD